MTTLKADPDETIQRACASDRGRQRERNEDACALPPEGADEDRLGVLLALADGAGGLPGGGQASRAAVEYLQALYYAPTGPENPAERLIAVVEGVNALHRQTRRRLNLETGYLTTLVAAVILADQVWVANLGDSRAYRVQSLERKVQQLTEDHSRHVRDVKAGLVEESDQTSREAGVITRAIGLYELCQADTYHYTWSKGDRLLLCSDGLSRLSEEEIGALLLEHDAEGAAKSLVQRAVEVDGSDNCTAVVAAWQASKAFEEGAAPQAEPTLLVPPVPAQAESTRLESAPLPVPEGAARARHTRRIRSAERATARRRRTRAEIWILLFGVVLGWLSAALFTILLLNQLGLIKLF